MLYIRVLSTTGAACTYPHITCCWRMDSRVYLLRFAHSEKVAGHGGFISHREGRGTGMASITREYVVASDR
jgi:hypothetical protein